MMLCRCDGCGKEAEAVYINKAWQKPSAWFQRDVSVLRHTYDVAESGISRGPTVVLICSLLCATLAADKLNKYLTI